MPHHDHAPDSLGVLAIEVLLQPLEAMRRVVGRRGASDLYVSLGVLFAAVGVLNGSVMERAMGHILAQGAAEHVCERAELELERMRWSRVAASPLLLAFRAGSSAIAIVVGCVTAGRSPPWVGAWRIAWAAETPELLGRLVDLETLWREGPEMTLEFVPLARRTTCLAEALSEMPASLALRAGADWLSPFTAWSIALACLGTKALGGSRAAAALTLILAGALHWAIAIAGALAGFTPA